MKKKWSDKYKKSINCDNPKGFSQRAHCQGKKKSVKEENLQEISAAKIIRAARKAKNETETLRGKLEPGRKEKKLKQSQRLAIAGVKKIRKEEEVSEESNPRIPRKKGQPANSKKHSDLYTDENPKGTIHGLGFKDVATAKASVSKIRNSSRSHAHKVQAAVAMEQRAREMGKTAEAAVYRKYINSMKKKTKKMNEAVMTPAQKRKDTRLKKKYEKSDDMMDNFKDQYGKKKGEKVFYAFIRKQAMKESTGERLFCQLCGKKEFKEECSYGPKMWEKFTIKNFNKSVVHPANEELNYSNWRQELKEEGLRDWFGKSSGTTKSGRKVRGWVQVGGKYDGKPCARQPGQKTTPKCVSSSKRRSMSKSERNSAARRKRAADPNQPNKRGAAAPTMVSTDPKKKKKVNEAYLRVQERGKTYTILLNWRGKQITTQMFFPSFGRPSKDEVLREIRKVYPNAIVLYFNPVLRDPTLPLLFAGGENESGRNNPSKSK